MIGSREGYCKTACLTVFVQVHLNLHHSLLAYGKAPEFHGSFFTMNNMFRLSDLKLSFTKMKICYSYMYKAKKENMCGSGYTLKKIRVGR